jgi:pyridoxine 5-phosphate synthase
VSLFINPDLAQIEASARTGAEFVELHTGAYAEARYDERRRDQALSTLCEAAAAARRLGLRVNGGHGLTYQNAGPVAAIPEIEELNIGHSIIARAVLTGLENAVREMKAIMRHARRETRG